MTNIVSQIKDKKHEYDNGQKLSKSSYTPDDFLTEIYSSIMIQQTPKNMRNTNKNRIQNNYDVAKNIKQNISNKYNSATVKLDKYQNETPRNKMYHWGALFDAVLDFYSNAESSLETENKIQITPQDYLKIPKRYRGAVTTKSKENKKKPTNKFTVFLSKPENATKFSELIKEAKILISTIYTKEPLGIQYVLKTDYSPDDWDLYVKNENCPYGALPEKNTIQSYCICDAELIALFKLQKICKDIIDLCLVTKHRTGGNEIFAEYTRTKKGSVLAAQESIRNAITDFRKTQFNSHHAMIQAGYELQQTTTNIKTKLKESISTRIK